MIQMDMTSNNVCFLASLKQVLVKQSNRKHYKSVEDTLRNILIDFLKTNNTEDANVIFKVFNSWVVDTDRSGSAENQLLAEKVISITKNKQQHQQSTMFQQDTENSDSMLYADKLREQFLETILPNYLIANQDIHSVFTYKDIVDFITKEYTLDYSFKRVNSTLRSLISNMLTFFTTKGLLSKQDRRYGYELTKLGYEVIRKNCPDYPLSFDEPISSSPQNLQQVEPELPTLFDFIQGKNTSADVVASIPQKRKIHRNVIDERKLERLVKEMIQNNLFQTGKTTSFDTLYKTVVDYGKKTGLITSDMLLVYSGKSNTTVIKNRLNKIILSMKSNFIRHSLGQYEFCPNPTQKVANN